jgi:hypothetical protein
MPPRTAKKKRKKEKKILACTSDHSEWPLLKSLNYLASLEGILESRA